MLLSDFRRNSLNLTRNDTIQPLVQSETDSSDEIDVFTTTRDGIIRFEEVAREPPHQTSLTLALGMLLDVFKINTTSYDN